jgi:hypothetical protein
MGCGGGGMGDSAFQVGKMYDGYLNKVGSCVLDGWGLTVGWGNMRGVGGGIVTRGG